MELLGLTKYVSKIAAPLRKYPNHFVVCLGMAVVFVLLLKGVDPLAAIFGPGFMILALFARECFADRHKERMAEKNIQKLEKTKGHAIRRNAQRVLKKETKQ